MTKTPPTPTLYQRLADALADQSSGRNTNAVMIGGAVGSLSSVIALALAQADDTTPAWLVVTPGGEMAEAIVADLAYLMKHPPHGLAARDGAAHHFPALEAVPNEHEPVPPVTAQARLACLAAMLDRSRPFLGVAPVSALIQRVIPPDHLTQRHVVLRVGEETDPHDFIQQLIALGFRQSAMVEYPGEVSSRGGIIDIFPHAAPNPWRIEFFGDEVASLRAFDAATQVSFNTVDEVDLVLSDDPAALHDPDGGKLPESVTLLDYLPAGARLLIIEPHELTERADLARKSWPQSPAFRSGKQLWEAAQKLPQVELTALASPHETAINLRATTVEQYTGEPDQSAEKIRDLGEQVSEIRILARNDAEARRMRELLRTRGVPLHEEGNADSAVTVAVGDLEAGFVCPEASLAMLQHTELLQKTRRRRAIVDSAQRTEAIADFLELHAGDLVVHVTHGIAQYRGMQTVSRDDSQGDFLELEFDSGQRLFVPAVNVSLVQKYIGARGSRPELSKLGGKRWNASKAKVEAAVLDMANDFLKLQAERMDMVGLAVRGDESMVQDFVAAFPFEETPDQEQVDIEIAADQAKPVPMDRLLCGDVGYGKTELAMRAAMRAVASGLQVAVLVPTTVLAEQHYQTFSERFAAFPITIDRLSRFRTGKETAGILERAATGGLDILIGTHRLLGSQVSFANLGLVVIDEEQRFGVLHKERLKHLRRLVDVLTLTATPIPRTLHMSLLGIRDISNLATPPHDRLSVHTEVTYIDDNLIRAAILRELDREGQVFFIHNRVYDIREVAGRIQRLVPEARVDYGHGQMAENDLQAVMEKFVHREIDVLVSTTIVESGLDIPSANTLFVSHADRFGLAELHQLRGRVGRYRHKAYAYFMVDRNSNPNEEARKRLHAIAEFSHLGSGFSIAMRDLELRGAGNIIGTEQSGQIAAVGYDLYCKLLQKVIARLRNDEPAVPVEGLSLGLQLGFDLRLPESWIPERRQRLDAYRKLFGATTVESLHAAVRDIRDRYGPAPEQAVRLIHAARLRLAAAPLAVREMRLRAGDGVFLTVENAAKVERAMAAWAWRIRVVDAHTMLVRAEGHEQTPDALLALLLKVFGVPDDDDLPALVQPTMKRRKGSRGAKAGTTMAST
ncbi:MAG: transcription-repair coupling factor [Planctomycetota bacterium]